MDLQRSGCLGAGSADQTLCLFAVTSEECSGLWEHGARECASVQTQRHPSGAPGPRATGQPRCLRRLGWRQRGKKPPGNEERTKRKKKTG